MTNPYEILRKTLVQVTQPLCKSCKIHLQKGEDDLEMSVCHKCTTNLLKAIVSMPKAGIDLNTSEQSQDVVGTQGHDHWRNLITTLVSNCQYGELPKEVALPNHLMLCVAKTDDGIYSGYVKRVDPNSGSQGEVLVQLGKMTAEAMVAALLARNYIPTPIEETPEVSVSSEGYSDLYSALSEFKGDLHIHLAKAELSANNDKIKEADFLKLHIALLETKG